MCEGSCTYSKSMTQTFPRRCTRCGKAEQLEGEFLIPSAEVQITLLEKRLQAALADVEHYRSELHKVNELKGQMQSAAISSADTAIKAIERIQEMEKVVEAAVSWKNGGPHAALTDAVNTWLALKAKWA